MANSIITAANPARDLLNTIIRKSHAKVSRVNMLKCVSEYGDYCKVMDCDKNLIADTIKNTPRGELSTALNELYSWYWKMDCIAAS